MVLPWSSSHSGQSEACSDRPLGPICRVSRENAKMEKMSTRSILRCYRFSHQEWGSKGAHWLQPTALVMDLVSFPHLSPHLKALSQPIYHVSVNLFEGASCACFTCYRPLVRVTQAMCFSNFLPKREKLCLEMWLLSSLETKLGFWFFFIWKKNLLDFQRASAAQYLTFFLSPHSCKIQFWSGVCVCVFMD